MSWSLGEVRALSIKAARGAGYSWGVAEEAGFTVRWLQKFDAPGVPAFANYLEAKEVGIGFCPLEAGTAISDNQTLPKDLPDPLFAPLLIIPFIVPLLDGKSATLTFGDTTIRFSETGVGIGDGNDISAAGPFTCSLAVTDNAAKKSLTSNRVPDTMQAHISVLEKFAHKTYAPDTEQSRLAGAGAGLNDND